MRGRKPQPEAVRAQKAPVRSVRRPRETAAHAVEIAAPGEPPRWLKDEALSIWRRLTPTLRQAKLLTDADALTFARYCRNYALWLKMRRQLDEEGEHYESESLHGRLKRVHPAFMVADRIERQLLAAEDRFGLNPAERQRIFAARVQTGVSGDLFAALEKEERRDGDVAAQPAQPAEPIGPIGLLN